MSGYQIYALLLTVSSIGVPNAISKMISEKKAIKEKYLAVKKEYEQAYAEYKKWAQENPEKVVDDNNDEYEFKMEE